MKINFWGKKVNSGSYNILKIMINNNRVSTYVWILLSIFIGIIPSINVIMNKKLINNISHITAYKDNYFKSAIIILIIMAAVNVLLEIITSLSEYLYQNSKSLLSSIMEEKLYNTILKYPIEKFESNNIYNKILMASQAIQMNSFDIIKLVIGIMSSIVSLLSVFLVLFSISWYLPLSLLLSSIPSGIGIIVIKKYRYKIRTSILEYARKNQYLSYLFTKKNAIKEIRIFNISKYLLDVWRNQKNKLRKKEMDILIKENYMSFIGKFVIQLCISLVSIYLISLISYSSITIGDYVSLLTAMTLFQSSLASISENSGTLYEMGIYLDALLEVINEDFEEPPIINTKIDIDEILSIKLENIKFKYPQAEKYALENISFEINKGDKIAIVGYNGSGKTTLINIIMGLYTNYEGKIIVNNNDLNNTYNKHSYYKKFSCIMQDFMKYDLSLRENIAFGNINELHNDLKLKELIKETGLSDYLSFKLDDVLSVQYKGGFELSGGEWQKIAIARSMISDAEVIIFDEPTSSLDPISEVKIFEQFNNIAKDKTSIIVSHRLGVTQFCNKIIVMDAGKIVEMGSHKELMIKNGLYKTLYTMQASKYQVNNSELKEII
ncbi:ABC transporter ATP-binding protein [Anaerocolumna chitinilytica]|uniref:ABC transporter ATP-binding protein n=1 Tax=Anaerocolumna chitinilytica TaxID=1727145 RepID=A0A7I8DJ17_9FIRM|nr:ABC transporter ATP-binding protein [Anaerocolumna chitinilytica]BCJ98350.1 ABC transporter ATP-binding protein [Anaerocolumna chitinilytica]